MARLSLNPAPTFKAKVGIPVPGGESAEVEFTFTHRSRSACLSWKEEAEKASDAEAVMQMVTGWDLDDAFTPENVARLCDNYPGAGTAIFIAYLRELRGERAKN